MFTWTFQATQQPQISDILYSKGLDQHIDKATQKVGHTLDLVITRAESSLIKSIDIRPPHLSDHSIFIIKYNVEKPAAVKKTVQ